MVASLISGEEWPDFQLRTNSTFTTWRTNRDGGRLRHGLLSVPGSLQTFWKINVSCSRRELMTIKRARRNSAVCLFFATCTMGLLISVVAPPLHAQYVHQLSYNGSNWMDQGLTGVP